jgi:hypothetical protein
MSRWQIRSVSAGSESTRIFYFDPLTGETCYRAAGWKPDGRFMPHDGTPGIGVDLDPDTDAVLLNGKVYPSSEFK